MIFGYTLGELTSLGAMETLGEANRSLNLISEAGEAGQTPEIAKTLNIKSIPNPTDNYFSLVIKSSNSSEQISLRIFDQYGKTVEQRTVKAGQVVQVGSSYHAGIYFAEAMQGKNRAMLRLVRL
jgi:hypothetical protein